MIKNTGVRIAPKSGQKHGKSLFLRGPDPELTPLLDEIRSRFLIFFKNDGFFRDPKNDQKMAKKWPFSSVFGTFDIAESERIHQKKGHFSRFGKKSSKMVKIGDFGGRPIDPQKKSRKIGLFGRFHFLAKKLERVFAQKWKIKQSHCR